VAKTSPPAYLGFPALYLELFHPNFPAKQSYSLPSSQNSSLLGPDRFSFLIGFFLSGPFQGMNPVLLEVEA
jgi:hypothetical protein